VFHGSYRNENDVFRSAVSLPWASWFSVDQTIKVKVSAQACPLKSLDFITLRIKDAVCDAFMRKQGVRPHVDTKTPNIPIHAFLDKTYLTLYLDTTGEPLFKRGWRCAQGVAPIRENLASGILRLAGWTKDQVLFDPMCGSGTILIEAGQMAKGIAPGIGRSFAFQTFRNYNHRMWKSLCRESGDQQIDKLPKRIFGCDRDPKAIRDVRRNLQVAGLNAMIDLKIMDALTTTPPAPSGILITNPPYGVRLDDHRELEKFYPLLGDSLKKKFFGWTAYVFTADMRLPKLIGLSPSKRVILFNGDLECRLYEFKLVQGSNRKTARLGGHSPARTCG
jgi:putative N6-adenine-specific DNA methylase